MKVLKVTSYSLVIPGLLYLLIMISCLPYCHLLVLY